uniref:hypothetical protein n=1 Tax=Bordetella sputigena TaxID=1416810 RepID=UPI0039F04775
MPPITGAVPAPLSLVTSPLSIQPTRRPHGLAFKAVQGLSKRIQAWHSGTPARAPYTLVRGEHEARMNKAARCRQRLAATTQRLYADARHPPAAGDLAKLQRDEAKLRRQTRVHDSLRDVLLDRTVRACLPDAGPRQAGQRCEKLIKLRQSALGDHRQTGAAPGAVRGALESATALQATAQPMRALCAPYREDGGRMPLTAPFVRNLAGLLDGMKMLRGQDRDAADFLYPAMKLVYEESSRAGPGAGDAMLRNLLQDLQARGDSPHGLRADLRADKSWFDVWPASGAPDSHGRHGDAARQGLTADIDKLLDGMAGAAGKVLREQLRAQVPAWAHEVQAGLFKEAAILHASVQRWHERGLAQGSKDALLQARPADAVRMVLEHAVNEALGTTAVPPCNVTPLLRGLRPQLKQITDRIQEALDRHRVAGHASEADIDALRQSLMLDVLEETGILGETHRLRADAADPRADGSADRRAEGSARRPLAAAASRGARLSSRTYQARAARRADVFAKHVRNAEKNAQRAVIKLLDASTRPDGKPLSAHKLEALREAYAALAALHAEAAPGLWRRLIDRETMRLKDRQLRTLNSGALHAHIRGTGELTASVADSAARAESDKLLGDIWTSIRAASARRNAGPFLKTWCASLAAPGGMAAGTTLYLQLNGLQDRIGMLADDKVDPATLLNAGLEEVGDTELGALIQALAVTPPAPDGSWRPSLGQRMTRYLRGSFRRAAADSALPARQEARMHAFLIQLNDAARAQAEKRMDALRDSLIPDFGARLFEHAGALETLLDKPEMLAVNGSLPQTLEQLIRDAAILGRLNHEHGGQAAAGRMGTRFLRTPNGYDVVRDLIDGLCRDISALHARLDAGMKVLGIARFQSGAITDAWRDTAVGHILEQTGIWDELNAFARRLPRDGGRQMDTPRLWAADGDATLKRGGVRASARSTQSVAADGYAKVKGLFSRRRAAPAAETGTDAATPSGEPIYASIRKSSTEPGYAGSRRHSTETIYAVPSDVSDINDGSDHVSDSAASVHSGDSGYDTMERPVGMRTGDAPPGARGRVSTALSDDSGFNDNRGSQLELDGHLYEVLHAPRTPVRPAPPPPRRATDTVTKLRAGMSGTTSTVRDTTTPTATSTGTLKSMSTFKQPDTAPTVDAGLLAALKSTLARNSASRWNRA